MEQKEKIIDKNTEHENLKEQSLFGYRRIDGGTM
jgi:hypothetical protein